jgi:hypothetical protein
VDSDDRTTEQPSGRPVGDETPVERYEIRVGGRLSARWAAWFDGFTLTNEDDGTTLITGPIVDQAALHGLLQKLRDLGTPLLSLARTESFGPDEPNEPAAPHERRDTTHTHTHTTETPGAHP